jgi:hypothetical protein
MARPHFDLIRPTRGADGGAEIGFPPHRLLAAMVCLAVSGWLVLEHFVPGQAG